MSDAFTTQELMDTKAIPPERVEAAVSAYMADPMMGRFALGNSYVLDLGTAVRLDPFACQVATSAVASDALKRAAVHRAILAARPEKTWSCEG